MEIKVGFVTPDNKRVYLDYDEVEEFCKLICESDDNFEKFKLFSEKYSYFNAYFDYVMIKLGYVFMNPLLRSGTYLKAINDKMFVVEDNDDSTYNQIKNKAIDNSNQKYYPTIVASSDRVLNIEIPTQMILKNWLIDPNGVAMIAMVGDEGANHEITGDTILNNLLISTSNLWREIDFTKYSVVSLIERFGFARSVYHDDMNIIIGVSRIFSSKVEKLIDEYKNRGFYYSDWEEMYPIDLNKFCIYPIGSNLFVKK